MPVTTAEIYAGLRYADGAHWPGGTITYSIPTLSPFTVWSPFSYGSGDEPSNLAYGVLDATEAAAFRSAVAAWNAVIGVNLVEVPDNGFSQGDIRIAFTDTADYVADDAAAYAYQPPASGFSGQPANGDVWIDDDFKGDPAQAGDFLYATFLHELGHALGLKHPFEGAALPDAFDNSRYTVMSYTDFADSSLRYFEQQPDGTLQGATFILQPSTPMLLDIIAAQGIYGAATNVAQGSDTWTIDQDTAFMATVVDTGGVDTLDLAAHTRASRIDLTPGTYSSIALYPVADQIRDWTAAYPNAAAFIRGYLDRPDTYTWSDNLATSPQTVIENVRAGAGDDTITGNAAANSLVGGAGSDSIFGGTGADTIDGGSAGPAGNFLRGEDGDDSIVGGPGYDYVNGNMGSDTVTGLGGDDILLGGKDSDLIAAGDGADFINGNIASDTCSGDAGADVVRGGQGNDSLAGGAGDDFLSGDLGADTLTGGAGADLFHAWSNAELDRVLDFDAAEGDRVILDHGTEYTLAQVGGDTVVQMSHAQLVLVGVEASSLPPGSIFVA